jgi:hypothetical protein
MNIFRSTECDALRSKGGWSYKFVPLCAFVVGPQRPTTDIKAVKGCKNPLTVLKKIKGLCISDWSEWESNPLPSAQ